jgi:hypothetical protein
VPPDGFDFSSGDPEKVAEQTMQIQAEQRNAPATSPLEAAQRQQAADDNRDWMLRDYTARLKKAGLASESATDPSAMAQPSDAQANTDPLSPPPDEATPQAPLRSSALETKPELSSSSLSTLAPLQPLLAPLNSPALHVMRDAWGSESVPQGFTAAPTTGLTPTPALNGDNGDSSSMDVPGLTAAENGIGAAAGTLGFQDALPDDSAGGQRKLDDQNNFLVPTAPTSDVTEFFKKQAEGLRAPNAPTVLQPPMVVAKPVTPVRVEPMAKPAVTGLRSHVDDPFDILQR